MGETVRRHVERPRGDEHEELAPRMVDGDRDAKQQEAAEETEVERDDAEADRERQANPATEYPTIDAGDARRVATHALRVPLHRRDGAPEAERAQIRCFSRLQPLLARGERAVDAEVVHAASLRPAVRASGAGCRTFRRGRDRYVRARRRRSFPD